MGDIRSKEFLEKIEYCSEEEIKVLLSSFDEKKKNELLTDVLKLIRKRQRYFIQQRNFYLHQHQDEQVSKMKVELKNLKRLMSILKSELPFLYTVKEKVSKKENGDVYTRRENATRTFLKMMNGLTDESLLDTLLSLEQVKTSEEKISILDTLIQTYENREKEIEENIKNKINGFVQTLNQKGIKIDPKEKKKVRFYLNQEENQTLSIELDYDHFMKHQVRQAKEHLYTLRGIEKVVVLNAMKKEEQRNLDLFDHPEKDIILMALRNGKLEDKHLYYCEQTLKRFERDFFKKKPLGIKS